MKKIKTYLIHLLGGVTKREAHAARHAQFRQLVEIVPDVMHKALPLGSLIAVKRLKQRADSINGVSADDWCKIIYEAMETDIKDYQKQFNKANGHEEHENNEPEQTETTDTANSEADK